MTFWRGWGREYCDSGLLHGGNGGGGGGGGGRGEKCEKMEGRREKCVLEVKQVY